MSESMGPERRPDCVFELDDVQGFDVEAIPCQEAIDAIMARHKVVTESADAVLVNDSAIELEEIECGDDPDRPAA
jgi:hypothetical protein